MGRSILLHVKADGPVIWPTAEHADAGNVFDFYRITEFLRRITAPTVVLTDAVGTFSYRKIIMNLSVPRRSSRIARRAVKQGARPTAVKASPASVEKSARDPNHKLLKCKKTILLSTFNVRTLHTINQVPELTANAIALKIA